MSITAPFKFGPRPNVARTAELDEFPARTYPRVTSSRFFVNPFVCGLLKERRKGSGGLGGWSVRRPDNGGVIISFFVLWKKKRGEKKGKNRNPFRLELLIIIIYSATGGGFVCSALDPRVVTV